MCGVQQKAGVSGQSGMSSMCQQANTVGLAQGFCTTATVLMDSRVAAQRQHGLSQKGLQLRFKGTF